MYLLGCVFHLPTDYRLFPSFFSDFQKQQLIYVPPPQNKDVDLLDIHSFNLTEAINTLYVTQPPIPESLSVFIIQGFSRCLKRLITPHPGCRGCLNFANLNFSLGAGKKKKKKVKKITKMAVFFFSYFLLSLSCASFLLSPLCAEE